MINIEDEFDTKVDPMQLYKPFFHWSLEEMYIEANGKKIYGVLYLPKIGLKPPYPCVVICHGFGSAHYRKMPFAEIFASSGIATFIFDFCGSSPYSMSSGEMKSNSIQSELEDIGLILDALEKDPRINEQEIMLMGASMGGLVATLYASDHPERIPGLILIYPAFSLPERMHNYFENDLSRIHPIDEYRGRVLSDAIIRDVWPIDVNELTASYPGSVLIVHGKEDTTVPVSYSLRALQTFPDANLIEIDREKHGFTIQGMIRISPVLIRFIRRVLGIYLR